MNIQQGLFLLLVSLVTLALIAASVIYFAQPAHVQTLNDCTREIVGNCIIIR